MYFLKNYSKKFSKICKKYKIPTAQFKICKNKKDVLKFLKDNRLPLVVKADGLAAGKGVYICKNNEYLVAKLASIQPIMSPPKFD